MRNFILSAHRLHILCCEVAMQASQLWKKSFERIPTILHPAQLREKESNYEESHQTLFEFDELKPVKRDVFRFYEIDPSEGDLVEGEDDAEQVDQDPEGVEDVMAVGTLVKIMLMLVWNLVMPVRVKKSKVVKSSN